MEIFHNWYFTKISNHEILVTYQYFTWNISNVTKNSRFTYISRSSRVSFGEECTAPASIFWWPLNRNQSFCKVGVFSTLNNISQYNNQRKTEYSWELTDSINLTLMHGFLGGNRYTINHFPDIRTILFL